MNSEIIITDLLDLNLDIEKNYLTRTVFLNKTLENHFQKNIYKNSFKSNLVSNIIIISGFLASMMFILVSYYKIIHIAICTFLFSISLIILIISIISKNKKFQILNDNIQIFLSFLNLTLKLIIVLIYFNTEYNDNEMEIIRIIIYQALSKNFYMITKLEANIFIALFYMFFNFILIIISILFCKRNHYFYLEICINFCVFLIFYLLRKEWDIKLRNLFAEKYKFEALYLYTLDYLNGLNGFTLNIKNNLNIFSNDKINNLIQNNFFENNKEDNNKVFTNKSKIGYVENKESTNIKKKLSNEIVNYHKSEDKIVMFLKNLVFMEKYADKNPCLFKKESNNLLDDEYYSKRNIVISIFDNL